jgi:hypothetical protein
LIGSVIKEMLRKNKLFRDFCLHAAEELKMGAGLRREEGDFGGDENELKEKRYSCYSYSSFSVR